MGAKMNLRNVSFICSLVSLLPALGAVACGDDSSAGNTDTDTSGGAATSQGQTSSATEPMMSTGESARMTSGSSTDASAGTTDGSDTDATDTGGAQLNCVGLDELVITGQAFGRQAAGAAAVCTDVPAPCGGSLEGTWVAQDECGWEGLPPILTDFCPDIQEQFVSSIRTATHTYNGDLTYEVTGDLALSFSVQVDSQACAMVDCDMFAGFLTDKKGTVMTCDTTPDLTCDCTLVFTQPLADSGTYAVFDGVVVHEGLDEDSVLEYCVDGDTLNTWTPIYDLTDYSATSCESAADCEAALGAGTHDLYVCDEPEPER